MTTTKAPPTTEELLKQAHAELTVLLPSGGRVRLRRLDGKPPSDELRAALLDADTAKVAEQLRQLGVPYLKRAEAFAAKHIGEEEAFRMAARALVFGKVDNPNDQVVVLPLTPGQ